MSDRYDEFEFACLVDAIASLATATREGKAEPHHAESVMRELSHVLGVLQEPEAAGDALTAANGFHADINIASDYEMLQDEVNEALAKHEVDSIVELSKEFADYQEEVDTALTKAGVNSLEELKDTLMLIPDGYANANEVLEALHRLEDLKK